MARETRGSPAGEKRLEQYGVWVKAGPREVVQSTEREEALELSDLDTALDADAALPDITDASPLNSEEEQLLNELETELGPASADETELPELTLEPEAGDEVEVTLSDSLPAEEHFDDLQALEDELASVTSASTTAASGGKSDAILARIEAELHSIRTDLTELKKELSGLRRPTDQSRGEPKQADEESPEAFFDEDEDETIALTGDELDNILNTAEITEEAAELPAVQAGTALPEAEGIGILDSDAALGATEDILNYETPVLEEDRLVPNGTAADGEELLELEAEPEDAGMTDTDLAADLVLETASAPVSTAMAAAAVDAFSDIELEGLPEIGLEDDVGRPGAAVDASGFGEPAEMEIPAELESLDSLEAVEDLEVVAEIETAEELQAATDGLADEVDLEALAQEAQERSGEPLLELDTDLEVAELDVAELEAVPDEKDKEIQIDFEADAAPAAASAAAEAEPLDAMLEVEEVEDLEPAAQPAARPVPAASPSPARAPARGAAGSVPDDLKDEIRAVLKYMDHLLEALPEEKIQEFAGSDYFVMYKKLFEELGLGE